VGKAAFVLCLGVAISLVIVVVAAATNGRALDPSELTAISTIFGAVVGAVATYLGSHAADRQEEKPKPEPDEFASLDEERD
jgi:Mn2+/Fe2+ NRAMP family transporter